MTILFASLMLLWEQSALEKEEMCSVSFNKLKKY